jgi:hypothetical protein
VRLFDGETTMTDAQDELLTTAEAAQLLTRSTRTLERDRLDGDGPPFIKLGHSVRYRRQDLLWFIEQNLRHSTSEAAGSISKTRGRPSQPKREAQAQ